MSLRLGEVLLRKGLLDEARLKKALDAQVIYGGHLGTCLVELGYLDVDTLAGVLGEQFSVSHANRDRIEHIAPHVVETLPRKLVERHMVVPFDLCDQVLHVAMLNPRNLLALDELSFVSGRKIEAWVAPELLIVRALERYYQVPRKLRHVPLSGGSPAPEARAEPSTPPAVPADRRVEEIRGDLRRLAEQPHAAAPQIGEPAAPAQGDFVVQPVSEASLASTGGPGSDGLFRLGWMKRRKGEAQAWCDLYDVPLEHPYFDGLEGVYVIWHRGECPVLRVGAGRIRECLSADRADPDLQSKRDEGPLFVSWATVPAPARAGVERYLMEMLNPQIPGEWAPVPPIAVNLPR